MRINSATPSSLQLGAYRKGSSPKSDELLMDLRPWFFFSLLICSALLPARSSGGSGEENRVISWSLAQFAVQMPQQRGVLGIFSTLVLLA